MVLFENKTIVASDDAGTTILKTVHPPPYIQGPYTKPLEIALEHVPSLSWFCLQLLYPYANQVHVLDNVRLRLPKDIISLLPLPLDPRLWATIVQLYDNVPPLLNTYSIPLSDIYLPLLQTIPCTNTFSLVTVLELPGCSTLTDETIIHLKFLTTLTAFDAAHTDLTPRAFKTLAATLQSDESLRGPWALRILSLRGCRHIDNDLFPSLAKFPLLSVVDLRGTRSRPDLRQTLFCPAINKALYYPAAMSSALKALKFSELYSSTNSYILHITSLDHIPSGPGKKSTIQLADTCVVVNSEARPGQLAKEFRLAPKKPKTSRPSDDDRFYMSFLGVRPSRSQISYTADQHRNRLCPSTRFDDHLMLYRDPPPWSALEKAAKAGGNQVSRNRMTEVETAQVNRSRFGASMEGLLRDVKRRKTESILDESICTATAPPQSLTSRRPSPLSLKPITSLKVPILSKEQQMMALAKEIQRPNPKFATRKDGRIEKREIRKGAIRGPHMSADVIVTEKGVGSSYGRPPVATKFDWKTWASGNKTKM